MKVDYMGYDIECTPEEFNELLSMGSSDQIKCTPHPHYSPYETGTPWWGIYPPSKITCGDTFTATSEGSVTITCGSIDVKNFAEKMIEGLQSKGIRIGR